MPSFPRFPALFSPIRRGFTAPGARRRSILVTARRLSALLAAAALAAGAGVAEAKPSRIPVAKDPPAPGERVAMFPFQIAAKFALAQRGDELDSHGSVYLGYARGKTAGPLTFFWGLGLELAGPLCGSETCEASTAGFALRLGIAQREYASGRWFMGRYGYLSIAPLAVDPDTIGEGFPTRSGLRVAVGAVDPLRLRFISHFRRSDPTGVIWVIRALNAAELMVEVCDGPESYCPPWKAGISLGIGI
jgi:hypothetical protein